MISLNYRDSRPIYEQIKENLKKLILTGAMQENDKLPSVRALATQLAINPNTIQRAYSELENEGYIYSIPGKGSFVAKKGEADMQMKETLMSEIRAKLSELRFLGVSEQELLELLNEKKEKSDD